MAITAAGARRPLELGHTALAPGLRRGMQASRAGKLSRLSGWTPRGSQTDHEACRLKPALYNPSGRVDHDSHHLHVGLAR